MKGIEVDSLCKEYELHLVDHNKKHSFKGLFVREKQIKTAVEDVSFSIQPGEMIGLIGANGSGKTKIMKLLTGILYPTSGKMMIDGHIPCQRENAFKKKISIVLERVRKIIPAICTPQFA